LQPHPGVDLFDPTQLVHTVKEEQLVQGWTQAPHAALPNPSLKNVALQVHAGGFSLLALAQDKQLLDSFAQVAQL